MLSIRLMTSDERAWFLTWVVEAYARESATSERGMPAEARREAWRQLASLLGGSGPGERAIFWALLDDGDALAGGAWALVDWVRRRARIGYLALSEQARSAPMGDEALAVVEGWLRALGIVHLRLNIRAEEDAPRSLYRWMARRTWEEVVGGKGLEPLTFCV